MSLAENIARQGYLTKLLANEAVNNYIDRHEPETLEHLKLVVNTVSMEEAVQVQRACNVVSDPDPA